MPVRKPSNRGSKKNVGKFPSIKMKRIICWESLIERDLIYLLEFDREVRFYEEQPRRITYMRDGKQHYYTPDFMVKRNDTEQFVEVKLEEKVKKQKYEVLFREISWLCQEEGSEFVVVTDKMIRVEPMLSNVKMLYRYARTPIHLRYQLLCQEFLRSKLTATVIELSEFFATKQVENEKHIVYALIYWGYLEADLMTLISSNAVISLPS